jgi:hypothetical protein
LREKAEGTLHHLEPRGAGRRKVIVKPPERFAILKNSSCPFSDYIDRHSENPRPSSVRSAHPISRRRSRALAVCWINVNLHDALHFS